MDNTTRVAKILSDLRSDDGITINKAISSFADLTTPNEKDEAFAELIKLLKDSNPWYRLRAVGALGALGDPRAVEYLIQTLDDDDEDAGTVMIEARFEALSSFKDPRAIKPLIEQIHRVDFKQAWDLYAFGDDAINPMIDALGDSKAYTRWQAAYWLGNQRDTRAVMPLVAILNDSDEHVRGQAIYSLGWIGSKEAIPYIAKLAIEPDSDVRKSVAYALGKINDPAVIPILQQLASDEDAKVKAAAMEGLEAINK